MEVFNFISMYVIDIAVISLLVIRLPAQATVVARLSRFAMKATGAEEDILS